MKFPFCNFYFAVFIFQWARMESESEQWAGVIRWRPHQPIFGRLSLRMPFVAAALVLVSLMPALARGGEEGMAFLIVGLHLGGILCMANIVLAFIAFSRHENPRWPAVTGLAMSVLPALGEVYLLCGAPW